MKNDAVLLVNEFLSHVNVIHGYFMDSQMGFLLWRKELEKIGQLQSGLLRTSNPELDNKEYRMNLQLMFGTDDSGDPGSKPLQASSNRDVKSRNSPTGTNASMVGNMSAVYIYQLWEDRYREKIARAMGFQTKDDLKSDIFGDLNLLRKSIIHNNGNAVCDMKKAKLLKWYQPDQKIVISFNQFNRLISEIQSWASDFKLSLA